MRLWRRKQRCPNLCPSPHPAYHGRQCVNAPHDDGMCRIKVGGVHYHYWNQTFYERRDLALRKENP